MHVWRSALFLLTLFVWLGVPGPHLARAQQAIGDQFEPYFVPTGPSSELVETRSLNQGQMPECDLASFLGMLESANSNQYQRLDAPRFSLSYLVVAKWLNYIRGRLWWNGGYTTLFRNGGNFFDALALARNYGLVPEDSWTPRVPFEQWDFAAIERDVLMASEREATELGKLAAEYGWQSTIFARRYELAVERLTNHLLEFTGPLPKQVFFNGSYWAPNELEKRYGFPHDSQVLMDFTRANHGLDPEALNQRLGETTVPFGGGWTWRQVTPVAMESQMAKWIDGGSPLLADLDWNGGGHAAAVVGYKTGSGGRFDITHWKVKNSLGVNFGVRGHAWYQAQDFRARVRRTWRMGARAP